MALNIITKECEFHRCQWTQRFDRVVEDAAAEWYPHIKFVRVCLGHYLFVDC